MKKNNVKYLARMGGVIAAVLIALALGADQAWQYALAAVLAIGGVELAFSRFGRKPGVMGTTTVAVLAVAAVVGATLVGEAPGPVPEASATELAEEFVELAPEDIQTVAMTVDAPTAWWDPYPDYHWTLSRDWTESIGNWLLRKAAAGQAITTVVAAAACTKIPNYIVAAICAAAVTLLGGHVGAIFMWCAASNTRVQFKYEVRFTTIRALGMWCV